MRAACFLSVPCEVSHGNEIPFGSLSLSALVSPEPLCDYYLLASVMSSSCFSRSSQTSAADGASWLLYKRVLFSTLLNGEGLCDPKYSPESPLCMQLVDSAASLPGGPDQHLSHHTPRSQLFSKDGSWCFVLALQLSIEFKTLLHIFLVGSSFGDRLLQHLPSSGQNSSHICKIVFTVSGNQRIFLWRIGRKILNQYSLCDCFIWCVFM